MSHEDLSTCVSTEAPDPNSLAMRGAKGLLTLFSHIAGAGVCAPLSIMGVTAGRTLLATGVRFLQRATGAADRLIVRGLKLTQAGAKFVNRVSQFAKNNGFKKEAREFLEEYAGNLVNIIDDPAAALLQTVKSRVEREKAPLNASTRYPYLQLNDHMRIQPYPA